MIPSIRERDFLMRKLDKYYQLLRMEAKERFQAYVQYIDPNYTMLWYHERIADACQDVFEGKTKRLMLFVPPQFGKSQLSSRMFPTWCLAKDQSRKIVIASYSSDLAESFNRDCQRIMLDTPYKMIVPQYNLDYKPIQNSEFYETGSGGFIKAVGIGGSLTGRPADLAIIDDPVKGASEAYSRTYRDKVWDWYTNVLETRLHNDSGTILIMTRWHQDDLAGRILKQEADQWRVISIPAVKETENPDDPRKINESLWEEKHSYEKLMRIKSLSSRTFYALYQQNPVEEGGNIIKSDWFRHCNEADFIRMLSTADPTFFIDTAYTNKTENDPSAILAAVRLGTDLYLYRGVKVLQKFPDLCRFIPQWTRQFRYGRSSSIRIEPKANGLSVIDQLRELTKLNVVKTPTPTIDKETKAHISSPYIESGRVVIVDGAWNDEFITEVCSFPAVEHDEYIDLLYYAIEHFLISESNDVSKLISAFR